MKELYNVFNDEDYDITNFVNKIIFISEGEK